MKQEARFSAEFTAWRVQKVSVLVRSKATQQQRLDVHGPVPRGPFQPAQPSRYVLGRSRLPAPIAPQIHHSRHNHLMAGLNAIHSTATDSPHSNGSLHYPA